MAAMDHIIVLCLVFTLILSPVWVRAEDPYDDYSQEEVDYDDEYASVKNEFKRDIDPEDYFGQDEIDYDEYYDDDTNVEDHNNSKRDITAEDKNEQGLRNVLHKFKPQINDKLQDLQNGMDALAHILKDISGKLGCENKGICSPPFKKILSGECLYMDIDKRKTWQEARETCQSLGADLAEPGNIKQDLDYIMRLSGTAMIRMGRDRFWVGASDQDKEGIWRWVSGSPVEQDTNWNPDHPSDITGREDCMAMIFKHPPGVYAQNCLTRKHFVCQKKYLIL